MLLFPPRIFKFAKFWLLWKHFFEILIGSLQWKVMKKYFDYNFVRLKETERRFFFFEVYELQLRFWATISPFGCCILRINRIVFVFAFAFFIWFLCHFSTSNYLFGQLIEFDYILRRNNSHIILIVYLWGSGELYLGIAQGKNILIFIAQLIVLHLRNE